MDNPGRLNFPVTVMMQRDDLLRRKFAPVDRVCHAIYQFLTKYNRILQRQNELAQEVSGLYFRNCFYLKCITRSMLNMCRCGEGGSHISLTLYFRKFSNAYTIPQNIWTPLMTKLAYVTAILSLISGNGEHRDTMLILYRLKSYNLKVSNHLLKPVIVAEVRPSIAKKQRPTIIISRAND